MLLAIAACTTARRETPPGIPPGETVETEFAAPFEPRWWLEMVRIESGLEMRMPENSSLVPPPVPPEQRIDVTVPLGNDRARAIRRRVAAHEGEPLVARLTVAPDAPLAEVLDALVMLHDAGVRRFDPGFLLAVPPPAARRAVPLPE